MGLGFLVSLLFTLALIITDGRSSRIENIVLTCIFSILCNLPVLFIVVVFYVSSTLKPTYDLEQLIIFMPIVYTISIIVIFFKQTSLHFKFEEVLSLIRNEKKNYDKIQNYRNYICKKHYLRPVLKRKFTFRNIQCQIDKNCTKNDIILAKQIVGLIGKTTEPQKTENNYYITVWNGHNKEITEADFDIIEIHENKEIKDYNAIISKTISFLYNELNRYKSINQITVRIFGNIELTESTKRLLEKRFLKVEYASNR
jgi:hypothetical protein